MTNSADKPIATIPARDVEDITQKIEGHDLAGALTKLQDAAHAMNRDQFHELLSQLSERNKADRQNHAGLPVLCQRTGTDGSEDLQIIDGNRSVSFGTGEQTPVSKVVPKEDGDSSRDAGPTHSDKPKEGVFYFFNEVSHDSVRDLTQSMDGWAADPANKDAPLRIVMNSPGGSVFDGFSMMDEIGRLRKQGHHVTIEDYGMAASAAGWIMQAADTRAIGANSWLLIHEPSSSASGKLSSMSAEIKLSGELEDQFLQTFAARSHLTVDQIKQHIADGHDWWIPAKEAKRLGLVDVIEAVPKFQPELDR